MKDYIFDFWEKAALPTLEDYIRIPNQSPAYDESWDQNGFMDSALDLVVKWVESQNLRNASIQVERIEGKTPVVFIDIASNSVDQGMVLLYGHLDKQPPFEGWNEGFGPYQPVIQGDKLYGRGGADDGYAVFAAVAAIKALQEEGIPHARCLILLEMSEESGSIDLEVYIDKFRDLIGHPDLIVCLDSGCGNYDQLWLTTSLRGLVNGVLKVSTVTEGTHSGEATGIVASSFRIARQLLSRIEDEVSGAIIDPAFSVEIPPFRKEEARATGQILQDSLYNHLPFQEGTRPVSEDHTELLLNNTWRAQLAITGAEGLPALAQSGSVLRPLTALKLSLRLPPDLDSAKASEHLKSVLESSPPYDAHVNFEHEVAVDGWHAPALEAWLQESLNEASLEFFRNPVAFRGEGASIPFVEMFATRFPDAQFVVTGVIGPHTNAHGPNESLDLPAVKKITCCIAALLRDHGKQFS